MPKGNPANYYDKTRRRLGCVTPHAQSQSEETNLCRRIPLVHLSGNRMSVRGWSSKLYVNMTSIDQLEQDEAIEMFDTEPWAQQLDLQWEKQFEQHEPPTEDKIIQVDVGNRDHPKPISISESLSLTEREELIALMREYINAFV